ncbi:hypothetical protein, partial [Psychromicrobium sp. YIM B11713]|uniref:hypothetical protein n=1 Tax=Psychromicrobium sp. YIM B11713 TaxID=3145233 RepID=UPI00374FD788
FPAAYPAIAPATPAPTATAIPQTTEATQAVAKVPTATVTTTAKQIIRFPKQKGKLVWYIKLVQSCLNEEKNFI